MAGAERYDRGKLRLESFGPGRQLNRWEQFGPLAGEEPLHLLSIARKTSVIR